MDSGYLPQSTLVGTVLPNLLFSQEDVFNDGFLHEGYIYFMTNLNRNGTVQSTLLRFCAGDPTFRSYAELPFKKNHDDLNSPRLTAAHFGDHPRRPEKALYFSFYSKNSNINESILSVVGMSTIVRDFKDAPKNCNREYFGEMCDMDGGRDRNICGSIAYPYVARDELPAGFFRYARISKVAQAITTVKHNDTIVVIGIGTDGSVFKVISYSRSIISNNFIIRNHRANRQTCVHDREDKHIYIRSSALLIKYPVASCGVHDNETLCFENGQEDHLHCGWCGDRCSTREECPQPSSFNMETCKKPKLYGIHPHNGPISGGTKVTLFGENLGNCKRKKRVFSVGKRICIQTKVEENAVTCTIGNQTYFKEYFPESLAIFVGNKMIYTIDEHPSVFNTTGLSQTFEFTPDPEIYHVKPGHTTISGLVDVIVTGLHLDNVENPKIVVKVPKLGKTEVIEIVEDCRCNPKSKGTTMICNTPPLPKSVHVRTPTSKRPLLTKVAFIMDGVQKLRDFNIYQEELSLLWYHSDPIFEKVRKNGDKTLVITVKNFLTELSGIHIRLGDSYLCNIVYAEASSVTCDIPSTLASNSTVFGANISVEVFTRQTWHEVGYITMESDDYAAEIRTDLQSIWWITFVLILACIIGLVFVYLKLRKMKSSINNMEVIRWKQLT